MTGNGRSFRQGTRAIELEREAKESNIRTLDLRSSLERYGVSFNMQGFAHCPFHKERTASFKVHGRFWHCFGCNESGELVKFVRKKFNLSYYEALDVICRDFGINSTALTIADPERLDRIRVDRYNCNKRYENLVRDLDISTELYWLAYDLLEYTIQFCGGKTIDNDKYVDAHFVLMNAQKALERAEYECAQFVRDNPFVVQKPSQKPRTPIKHILPPAPKWETT